MHWIENATTFFTAIGALIGCYFGVKKLVMTPADEHRQFFARLKPWLVRAMLVASVVLAAAISIANIFALIEFSRATSPITRMDFFLFAMYLWNTIWYGATAPGIIGLSMRIRNDRRRAALKTLKTVTPEATTSENPV